MLLTHCQFQHSVVRGTRRVPPPPSGETQNYRVCFPKRLWRLWCPVEGCLGGASNQTNLWVHFAHLQAQDTIMILEEGNRPNPRCTQCDMFMSHKALRIRHMMTSFYQEGVERKRRRLAAEESRVGAEPAFTEDGIPLVQLTSLKYIIQIIMEADDNWPAVVSNLRKARQKWARLTGLLGEEGVHARTLGQIY